MDDTQAEFIVTFSRDVERRLGRLEKEMAAVQQNLQAEVDRVTALNTALGTKFSNITADIAALRAQIAALPPAVDTTALDAALTKLETTAATPVDPGAVPPLAKP